MYFLYPPSGIGSSGLLSIRVRPEDFKSDPDLYLYISVNGSTPTFYDRCNHYGFDVCFIPQDVIVANKVTYILIDVSS